MSEKRRPGSFRVPNVEAPPADLAPPPARLPRALNDLATVTIEPDEAEETEVLLALDPGPTERVRRRGFSFGKLFLAALGAIVSLGFGLALDALIRDLFERAEWLGWLAVALSALLVLGAVGVAGREILGLLRLDAVEKERADGLRAFQSNSDVDARRVVDRLAVLLADKPDTAAGRARLAALKDEVIDGRDLVVLAERELLVPIDAKARALALGSAKRVSLVTAVSPRAIVDLAFVLFETFRLIRRMSELYGARPGTIGLVRLTRDVLAHLAVTGSIAVGDSLVSQIVGHGLASRLSAKLGEGVVNGLLTARVGLAAMDLCRPLPFIDVRRPTIGDFLGELTNLSGRRGSSSEPDGGPRA